VRMAVIGSIQELCTRHKVLARIAVELLVDMLNDEINEVRVKAIQSVGVIVNENDMSLNEDQLNVILAGLEDQNRAVRHSLHRLLAHMALRSTLGLHASVEALLKNLQRYVRDANSIFSCCGSIGKNHPAMVELLVDDLLALNAMFLPPEPNADSSTYVAKLVLIYHAAAMNRNIFSLLPAYCHRHFSYLYSQHQSHLPPLLLAFVGALPSAEMQNVHKPVEQAAEVDVTRNLFDQSFDVLQNIKALWISNRYAKASHLLTACRDAIQKLALSHPQLQSHCSFCGGYVRCLGLLTQLLRRAANNSVNCSNLPAGIPRKLLVLVHNQQTLFSGLSDKALMSLAEIRLLACLLLLAGAWMDSCRSELVACLKQLATDLSEFCAARELSVPQICHTIQAADWQGSTVFPVGLAAVLQNVKEQYVVLKDLQEHLSEAHVKLHPIGTSSLEKPLNCVAQLPHSFKVDGVVGNISDLGSLAIKVFSPDQTEDVYPLSPELDFVSMEDGYHQLRTKLRISSNAWNGAGVLEVSVVQLTSPPEHAFFALSGTSTNVQMCKPQMHHLIFRSFMK